MAKVLSDNAGKMVRSLGFDRAVEDMAADELIALEEAAGWRDADLSDLPAGDYRVKALTEIFDFLAARPN